MLDKIIIIVRIVATLADEVSQWVRGSNVVPDAAKAALLRAELVRMGVAVALAGKSVDDAIARSKLGDPNPLNATVHATPDSFDTAIAAFEERQAVCVTAGRHNALSHCAHCKGD